MIVYGGYIPKPGIIYEPILIESPGSHMTIEVPARPEYVKILRTILASLAAGMDFSVECLDDLKMAVGEGATQLLEAVPAGTAVRVEANPVDGGLQLELSAEIGDAAWPPAGIENSLAWRVLSTVARELKFQNGSGKVSLKFRVASSISR